MAETDVLQSLLAEEHAAIYLYGVLAPRLPAALREAARTTYDDHRRHRDTLEQALIAAELTPVAALPAYAVPPLARPRDVAAGIERSLLLRWHAALAGAAAADLALVTAAYVDEATHLTMLTHQTAAFPGR